MKQHGDGFRVDILKLWSRTMHSFYIVPGLVMDMGVRGRVQSACIVYTPSSHKWRESKVGFVPRNMLHVDHCAGESVQHQWDKHLGQLRCFSTRVSSALMFLIKDRQPRDHELNCWCTKLNKWKGMLKLTKTDNSLYKLLWRESERQKISHWAKSVF